MEQEQKLVKVTGLKNTVFELSNLVETSKEDIMKIIKNKAVKIQRSIRLEMRNTPKFSKSVASRSGRVAGKRRKNPPQHFPSLRGNPPAIDTGNLLRHIEWDFRTEEVEVGVSQMKPVPYGFILEETKKRRLKRPFIRPEFDELLPDLEKSFANLL